MIYDTYKIFLNEVMVRSKWGHVTSWPKNLKDVHKMYLWFQFQSSNLIFHWFMALTRFFLKRSWWGQNEVTWPHDPKMWKMSIRCIYGFNFEALSWYSNDLWHLQDFTYWGHGEVKMWSHDLMTKNLQDVQKIYLWF